MFQKQNVRIESLERALKALKEDNERLEAAWAKERLDLTEIKEQVLRNLNRLVTRQRDAAKKAREPEPELPESPETNERQTMNPLAAAILKGR